jgi:hypothetical protein
MNKYLCKFIKKIYSIIFKFDILIGTICISLFSLLVFMFSGKIIEYIFPSKVFENILFIQAFTSAFIGGFIGLFAIIKKEVPIGFPIKQNKTLAIVYGIIMILIFWSICIYCMYAILLYQ